MRLLLNELANPNNAKERLHKKQQSEEATTIKRESKDCFNLRKYIYHAYIEYIHNTGLNNPLSSLVYFFTIYVKEAFKKRYL